MSKIDLTKCSFRIHRIQSRFEAEDASSKGAYTFVKSQSMTKMAAQNNKQNKYLKKRQKKNTSATSSARKVNFSSEYDIHIPS